MVQPTAREAEKVAAAPRRSGFGAEDFLRIQLTCNSLDAWLRARSEGAETAEASGGIAGFLASELPVLMRAAEKAYVTNLGDGAGVEVKLTLLREDHARLRQLAASAARSLEAMGQPGETADAVAGDDAAAVRSYVAAQRHQLAWYRDHLERPGG